MLEGILKPIKGLFKPLEGFQKEIGKEIPYFLLGIGMEGGKGLGWKGSLFVWPFLLAFVLCGLLILKTIVFFVWGLFY